MQSRLITLLVILMGITVYSASSQAESRGDTGRGSDPVRKAQLMLRKLSQDKVRLEAENARLVGELLELKTELNELGTDLGKNKKKLGTARASNEKLVARVRGDNEKMKTLIKKYRDTVQLLHMEKANVAHLTNAVTERNQWIGLCKTNNDGLVVVNNELVDRYRNRGVWKTLRQSEPLLGIGGVELEVIAEDYTYRIEDLQVVDFNNDNKVSSRKVAN